MKTKKIDVLHIESDKKTHFKDLPLSFRVIAIILIVILLFIPVVFI